MNYCRVNASDEDESTELDNENWQTVYDSYVDIFGLQDIYKEYLKWARKLALAQNNWILTKNDRIQNDIKIYESEIEKVKSQMNYGVDTGSVLVMLSKYMGYRQDPKQITAYEYFKMIEEHGRG